MADTEDVNSLKRRGRRRLVGAIALVLLAVIVLPMVFDAEPRRTPPPVSVRIPGEDDAGFTPKVTPKAPPAVAEAPKPEAPKPGAARPEASRPEASKPEAAKALEKPAAKPEPERKRAEAAPAGSEQFVVQVGAFMDSDKVKEITGKLAAATLPHYTEPVATAKGTVTRVRVGPYSSREGAEQALQKLQQLGLKGGKVVSRS